MSFHFRSGHQLIRIRTPPLHIDSLPGYNTDSDNDVNDDFIPDPYWNYTANMPQDDVDGILDDDAEITRNLEPQIPLPPETKLLEQ